MNFDIRGVILAVVLFVIIWILSGCDNVKTGDRLIYEDGTPAKNISMTLKSAEYEGSTRTEDNGSFVFTAPKDILVELCAYPKDFPVDKSCYDGLLLTPMQDGSIIIPE